MDVYKIKKYKGGWFIGNFTPTIFKTKNFEVGYKIHLKEEKWPTHLHKFSTEINYLIRGKMKIQNKTLKQGDIFVIHPNEIADPIFIEDCELIVVKIPSIKNDKYTV